MTDENRDRTLDSFVAAWGAPPPGSQFHSRVRLAFDREFVKVPWWRRWDGALAWRVGKSLCGGAAIGAFFVAMIGLAFPQTTRFRLPWLQPSLTMDFEEIVYSDDGKPTVASYVRTVPMASGKERVLWNYSPDHPYDNMFQRVLNEANYLLERITLRFFEDTNQANVGADLNAAYVKSGCLRGSGTISGKEILLGYSTTIVLWNVDSHQPGSWARQGSIPLVHWRAKEWRAPGLGCRVLKSTAEARRPDGTYHLIFEMRALDVTP